MQESKNSYLLRMLSKRDLRNLLENSSFLLRFFKEMKFYDMINKLMIHLYRKRKYFTVNPCTEYYGT